MDKKQDQTAKKPIEFPHTYVILFAIVLLVTIMTYLIPAGSYQRVMDEETGHSMVDPNSFTYVDSTPVGLFALLTSIPTGMVEVADIMTFIFIVGGAFQIITETGALEKGVKKIAYSLRGREKLLVPLMVFIFSLSGATFGLSEETIIFVPIGIALARAMGYDAMVGMGIIILGAGAGFSSGFMNPFNVGVAQEIAELPTYSGMNLRIVVWIVLFLATAGMILRYGNKVKKDPKASLIWELEAVVEEESKKIEDVTLSKMDIRVLCSMFLGLVVIIWGVTNQGWYVIEIASVFLAMGLLGGILGGKGPNEMAKSFLLGTQEIASGALMVGVARAILVIMTEGQILDTVVYQLASVIGNLPKAVAAIGMLVVQCCINFFIPSGSGQASATMPIMVPLADVLGLTRQTAVLAFQFGDGFTNSILPMGSVLCVCLGTTGATYDKWLKFALPIVGVQLLLGVAFLVLATVIDYGPF